MKVCHCMEGLPIPHPGLLQILLLSSVNAVFVNMVPVACIIDVNILSMAISFSESHILNAEDEILKTRNSLFSI